MQNLLEVNKVHNMDCLDGIRQLDDNSIDMCVTSPPYWGLRDYGVPGQIGLERNFYEYITKLCYLFDDVKRVLKKEGSLWVNIGESYSRDDTSNNNCTGAGIVKQKAGINSASGYKVECNIPEKSMCLIPHRFAIEMINHGWILRNTIIWHKPNAMPSSVTDRFTVDYEYLFFFVKSKKYYFEQQKEPLKDSSIERAKRNCYSEKTAAYAGFDSKNHDLYYEKVKNGELDYRNKRSVWPVNTLAYEGDHIATYPEELIETPIKSCSPIDGIVLDPFIGSGTTGVVSLRLNRKFIGFELNPNTVKEAYNRIYSSSATLDMFIDKEKVIV
jgi:site-specific DNA-methyltransferase (adenine-specific)